MKFKDGDLVRIINPTCSGRGALGHVRGDVGKGVWAVGLYIPPDLNPEIQHQWWSKDDDDIIGFSIEEIELVGGPW